MSYSIFNTLTRLPTPHRFDTLYHSLPALERAGIGNLSRMPISLRVVLESLLRNCDGKLVGEAHIRALANWQPNAPRSEQIPFVVARVVLQDFTGIPLLCDLAAMRQVARARHLDPRRIEPRVPVDLVVDHSLQVDHYGNAMAIQQNLALEFERNRERYEFLKWGQQAFDTFHVVPPGIGIVHQVNLEYLFKGLRRQETVEGLLVFPDSLVGTDSHTTMINGVGVVGWGVGGIEAEAAMLGQPAYFLAPDVVGVELSGRLPAGVTVTDLALTLTEMLRREKVIGAFVEFYGEGVCTLSAADRATLASMAPEYGATIGYFPVDEHTLAYMRSTGHDDEACEIFEAYFKAQEMFGVPLPGEIDYSRVIYLDLSSIVPSLAGPKRPQDRIALPDIAQVFNRQFSASEAIEGFDRPAETLNQRYPTEKPGVDLGHGDVLIAAITSCAYTGNPALMIAAGVLAKKAVEKGLCVKPHIKTSLAPGSRVVTDYLEEAGLLAPLADLGFSLAGYGCATCIGNAGDLDPAFDKAIDEHQLVAVAVLSGNRNFEARIHPRLLANFVTSPPLVVAFAIAGRANIDLTLEPLGYGDDGQPVFLRDIWPGSDEISAILPLANNPSTYRQRYGDFMSDHDLWNTVPEPTGEVYGWPPSTYIARPPFLELPETGMADIRGARPLLILGDSVSTDHISPTGSFDQASQAGKWLLARGVLRQDFNTYGSRCGQHEIMIRGTFANVRLRNLMLPPDPKERRAKGGFTLLDGQVTSVFEAAMAYRSRGVPLIVIAGDEYGTGSSRDWAAKGTRLLGVRAVIARSFESIHRANLVGMGVLPLQFAGGDSAATLDLRGDEHFDIIGIEAGLAAQQALTLVIRRASGERVEREVLCRIDTPIEIDYYRHGGILPYLLEQLLAR